MIRYIQYRFGELCADTHLREVLQAASSAFLLRLLGTLLGFVVSVIVARLLGAEGSGVYYLAASVVVIAATIGQMGFENTVIRFVASHAAVGEWRTVRFVYRTAITTVALASLVVSLLIFSGAGWMARDLFGKPGMEVPLILMAAAVVPFSLSMIQSDALRGLKQIPASQLVRSVLPPLASLILIYPFALLWQANGAIAAYLVAALVAAGAGWFFWSQAFNESAGTVAGGDVAITLRPLFQSSWPLFGVTLTGIAIQQVATILLGVWSSSEDVGIFNVASRVSSLLLFPLMAMTCILAPKFAAMHRHGQREELIRLVRRSSTMLMMFAAPAVIVMFAAAERVMGIFGSDFVAGAWPLRLLLLGVLVNVSTGAMGELLVMTGNEKLTRDLNVMGALSIVVLCLLLIPPYGDVGAAIAVGAGYTFLNLLMALMVKRRLGFWPVGFRLE